MHFKSINRSDRFRTFSTSLVLFVSLLGSSFSTRTWASDDLEKVILSKPVDLPAFKLTDQNHKPFTQTRFKGKWTFVFFGYTHCPDVCPVTLSEMNKIIDVLPPGPGPKQNNQYVFITVDPARDTADALGSFVSYFNTHIIGLTGNVSEIRKLANAVKIRFSRGEGTKTEYTMNHSSAMLLIDPQGRYYARFRAPHYVDRIHSLFRKIRRHYEETNHIKDNS